jgi:uncharacterized membrane protein
MAFEHNPRSTARIAGHPIHPMLVPFPIAFFVGALVTDLIHRSSGDPFWARGSVVLLIAGLIMAALAAVAGLADVLGDRLVRQVGIVWWHMTGNVIAVLLELWNLVLRLSRGAENAGSLGLTLSAVVVLILLVTGWLGWEMVYRRHVGISDEPPHSLGHHPPGHPAE